MLRGIRSLPQRMRTHAAVAQEVANYLNQHPKVLRTHYPGLPEHPQHELAKKQMSGFGGMVTFELEANQAQLDIFFGKLQLFSLAESLGGVESLIEAPWYMSHVSMSEEARATAGIKPGTIRVSVGLEHADDLIQDIENGLAAL